MTFAFLWLCHGDNPGTHCPAYRWFHPGARVCWEHGAVAAGVCLEGSDWRWLPKAVNEGTTQMELTCGFVADAEVL